jgi:hypothetical protein
VPSSDRVYIANYMDGQAMRTQLLFQELHHNLETGAPLMHRGRGGGGTSEPCSGAESARGVRRQIVPFGGTRSEVLRGLFRVMLPVTRVQASSSTSLTRPPLPQAAAT